MGGFIRTRHDEVVGKLGHHTYLYHPLSNIFNETLISPCCNLGYREDVSGTGHPQVNKDLPISTKDNEDYLRVYLLVRGHFDR